MTEGAGPSGAGGKDGTGKRAVLYARVSTEEQATKGYSLAGQLEALKEYAVREGYKVVGEAVDPGHSGATLERGGVDLVRELASAGEVDAVLAREIDRVSREPWHYEYLKAWLAERGVDLRALDDDGDGSPIGDFVAYIRRGVAKLERADIARRTANGKLQKAREGRVVAPGRPRYGFKTDATGDDLEVDEEKMGVVRRVFRMVAGGASLSSVRKTLDREGVPTPGGARFWDRSFVKKCVEDDAYKPHTFEEVRALVSPGAAARLDPTKRYGIVWFNRRALQRKRAAELFGDPEQGGNGRRRHRWREKPKEEQIPIPVPDAGVPRELVDSARVAIEDNRRPSSAGGRSWELSGGIARCAECGRRASPRRKTKTKNGKRYVYHYYQCVGYRSHGREGCQNSRLSSASGLEERAWERVRDFLAHPDRLEVGLNRLVEEEREGLLADPAREAEGLQKRIAAAERERANYHKMAAKELISFGHLAERLAEVDAAAFAAREDLGALSRRRERLRGLERDRDALLRHYEAVVPPRLDALSPEQRRRIHNALGTEVLVARDGGVRVRLKKVRLALDRPDDPDGQTCSVKSWDSPTSARTVAR